MVYGGNFMIYVDLQAYADPILEHDYEKCGLCWKNKIMADIAHKYLDFGIKVTVAEFHDEVDKRWKRTKLYRDVQKLLAEGYKIEEIEKIMMDKGIEI